MEKDNDYMNFVERMGSFEMDFEDISDEEIFNQELKHFGVLGMKWGIRRSETKSSKNPSEEYTQSRLLKSKSAKELSNAELKALTNRLQLEKQYNDLSPSDYKKGLNAVKTITAAGTTVASLYALTKTPLAQDIIKALKAKMG